MAANVEKARSAVAADSRERGRDLVSTRFDLLALASTTTIELNMSSPEAPKQEGTFLKLVRSISRSGRNKDRANRTGGGTTSPASTPPIRERSASRGRGVDYSTSPPPGEFV